MICGIIAVIMGITLNIIGNVLSTAQEHNRKKLSIIGWGLMPYVQLQCSMHAWLYAVTM